MSRTRKHHYTWQYWGEERKQRSLCKEHENWKKEALEELDMEEYESVFVIINEWEANDEDPIMEIVGGRYFDDEDLAWERLEQIAESYGVDLPAADNSFEVPSETTYETYYIMELVSFDEAA